LLTLDLLPDFDINPTLPVRSDNKNAQKEQTPPPFQVRGSRESMTSSCSDTRAPTLVFIFGVRLMITLLFLFGVIPALFVAVVKASYVPR
tara:strand:- start:268 stop:537 length:270 start_codon:yes stop_codon:yes gene_type:complete